MPRPSRPRLASSLTASACLLAISAALAVSVASTPLAARAQTVAEAEREEDYVRVVQPLPFTRGGRLAIAPLFSLSINDPLVETFTAGANMTYFFKDFIGITFGFHYAFDAKRSAQNALLSQQVRPETNPLKWVGGVGVEWVPIYGKFSLFNRSITHWDVYLTAGGAVQATQHGSIGPAGFLGLGTRFFLSSWLTLNVDVRDYLYNESFPSSDGARQLSNFASNLFFGVGVSFFVPSVGAGASR